MRDSDGDKGKGKARQAEQNPTEPMDAPHRRLAVEALAGLSAGFGTTLITHPLDFLKLRLQLDTTATSQTAAIRNVWRNLVQTATTANGQFSSFTFLTSMYRGIGPNLIGSTSAWALYFYLYRQFKNVHLYAFHTESEWNDRNLKSWHYLSSAFLAGWSTSILTNPIWVIKTRMIATNRTTSGAYTSILDGIRQIYTHEGVFGFYRGLVPALFSVAQGAVQLSLYDLLKRHLINSQQHGDHTISEQLTTIQYFYASSVSKMISTIIFYPLQVLRSRLQILTNTKSVASATHIATDMLRREGVAGFYKGLPANLCRVVPATCTTFIIYEKVKQLCG